MNWENISLVTRSQRRKEVLACLDQCPKMPSTIRDETDKHFSEVSECLNDLLEAGLVIRLNESKKGRYYKITDDGEKVLNYIDSQDCG